MITPLPASSAKLRERRYQADVHGARNDRGASPFIAEGRFVSAELAKRWADETHPDAELVKVTLYSARTGWRPQSVATRRGGEWS